MSKWRINQQVHASMSREHGWPGAPYLRKVDLQTYKNYIELSSALEKMSSCNIRGALTLLFPPQYASREGCIRHTMPKSMVIQFHFQVLDDLMRKRPYAQEVLDHPWLENIKKAPNVSLCETGRKGHC